MDVPGIAIITGAASGIGAATAMTLARDGCSGLALCDVNTAALTKVKKLILAQHQTLSLRHAVPRIEVYQLDVTSENDVDATVLTIANAFQRIDYLINAAGIAKKHIGGAAFAETSDWARVLDVNLNGTFYMLRAVVRIMLKQQPLKSTINGRDLGRGSIVNFASILGAVGVPMSTAYTASKHAVLGLTRTASEDYAKDGIRINAVCPGYTETNMTMGDEVVRGVMMDKIKSDVPIGRMGHAEEIADAVVFLCGGRSSFVVGTGIFVDGGYTQR